MGDISKVSALGQSRKFLILIILALFSPAVVGFQYLEWLSGGTHFTFIISSTTWNLTYSDWYFDPNGGWIFFSFEWLVIMIQNGLLWMITHTGRNILILFVLTPIVRLCFVAVVILYRQNRIEKPVLIVVSILVLAVSIAHSIVSMVINTIYGISPGWYYSITAWDIDVRLFVPVPILLLVGLHFSRKKD